MTSEKAETATHEREPAYNEAWDGMAGRKETEESEKLKGPSNAPMTPARAGNRKWAKRHPTQQHGGEDGIPRNPRSSKDCQTPQ